MKDYLKDIGKATSIGLASGIMFYVSSKIALAIENKFDEIKAKRYAKRAERIIEEDSKVEA